jgi:hypothetical protein
MVAGLEGGRMRLEFVGYYLVIRASPRVCQILLGKSFVLPTSKKIYQVKKSSSPTDWHNSLAKSRSNLHQES